MEVPYLHSDTIEEVQQRVDIVEVISEYVVLRQRGKDYVGLCPFHNEKTPSFSVSPHKQLYYCFGCGVGGNTFKFLMEVGKQSFAEVVLDLARRYQIPVKTLEPQKRQEIQRQLSLKEQLYEIVAVAASFYEHALRQSQGEVALTYLRSTRRLADSTISQFQLGYAPCGWETLYRYLIEQKRYSVNLVEQAGLIKKRSTGNGFYDVFRDRIMIPVADSQGRLIGFGSRTISAQEQPKYLNSKQTPLFDKSKTLYALDRARRSIGKEDRAIVVEGYFDAIALHAVGISNVVASLGTAFTAYQLHQLIRYTPSSQVILNFDADKAGRNATARAIKEVEDLVYAGVVNLRILNLPDGKDADEYLNSRNDAVDGEKEGRSVPISNHRVEMYQKSLDNAPLWLDWQINQLLNERNLKTPEGMNQVATGMVKLLDRLQDANARNYYLSYCAELLSQGDARLIAQNLESLKNQLSPKIRKKIAKYREKPNNRSFAASINRLTKSPPISQSKVLPVAEAEKTELPSQISNSDGHLTMLNQGEQPYPHELSSPPLSPEENKLSISIAVNPETELLEQAESLLLLIYIHCPRYREEIIANLEEKDLLFSLPHHRFLWQKILELERTSQGEEVIAESNSAIQDYHEDYLNITKKIQREDDNPLLTELHNCSVKFPKMMQKVNDLLHLNEKTQADLSRTSTLIENAIASLELVVAENYKLYCVQQFQNLELTTDSQFLYYCQELQKTEKIIQQLEPARYFTQTSQITAE